MKLLYIFLFLSGITFSGFFIANTVSFDMLLNPVVINSLLAVIALFIAVWCVKLFINYRRKLTSKDVMTIRQYYNYRSAR